MSAFWSRIVVSLVLLPVILGIVWLGGWWLFAAALLGGLIALHELYAMGRGLRPLVLGGYVGLILTLLGAEVGEISWMVGGIFATVVVAFVVFGFSDARPSATAAISLTLLGVVWVGGGLAAFILLRDIPEHGRLVVFTVLIAVFADDTAAYFVGRTIGRHKMAPTISPGKSWEGFVGGTIAAMAVAFFAMYDQGFLTDIEARRARSGDRGVVDARRPVRVGDQARPRREGLRAPSGRARRRARPHRFHPLGRPGRLLRRARADVTPLRVRHPARMKRVALLGATGSIGAQAIDIVERNPELELCALMSGTRPLAELAAAHGVEHVQVGGSAAALLRAGEPDIVLNAIVGFAGVEATLWALERGITLALANKESLVAAGELALGAHRRGGGLLLPVDSEHSAIFQCLEGRDRDTVESIVLTASGGPFRGRSREELEHVTIEEALAHPTWSMGRKITVDSATLANKGLELIEAHWLFGIPYDRIEVVVHPTSVVHSLVRFRDGALLAHLGQPDMRVPISFALTYPERAAVPAEPLDLAAGLDLHFEAPDAASFPLLPLAREAGERGGTYPCAYNAANEVAVAAFLDGRISFPEIADTVADALEQVDGAPARDLDDLVAADAASRRAAERRLVPA